MVRTVSIRELIGGVKPYPPILYGKGAEAQVIVEPLTKEEEKAIRAWLAYQIEHLARISPKLADDLKSELEVIIKIAEIFKAETKKTYNVVTPHMPKPAEIGVNILIPQFFGRNNHAIDVTAGTAAYLWGSATAFFKTESTPERRFMIYIPSGGIIHIGDTPVTHQWKFEAEGVSYAPFTVHPLVVQSIEIEKPIYQYPLHAFLLDWKVGTKLSFMPERSGTVEFEIIGVVFYERDAYSDLTWK